MTDPEEVTKPAKLVIGIRKAHRGRVTGFAVYCSDHGVMPVLAPSKSAALAARISHANQLHAGAGRLR